jgi:hypothetical protein
MQQCNVIFYGRLMKKMSKLQYKNVVIFHKEIFERKKKVGKNKTTKTTQKMCY